MTKQFLDELRKGNLIEWQHDLKNNLWIHSRVKEIHDEHVVLVNLERIHFSRLRPWPLTEKILEAYGFFKETYPDSVTNYSHPKLNGNYTLIPFENYFQFVVGYTEFWYVHELQNIFFDLNKKQLRFLNDKEGSN